MKDTRKPKVVRIIGRLNVGGAARQACLLHDRLADEYETHLIAGSLAEGEGDMGYLLASEHNVLRVPQMSREISPWSDAIAFLRILRFLRRERPEIVHTHTAKAGTLGRLAARLARVPVIVHSYHGHVFHSYFRPAKTRIFLAIERLMGRLSTRLVAVSESQVEELSATFRVAQRNKFVAMRNGFELDCFSQRGREEARNRLGLVADDFVVAWAGRMAPVKDLSLLARVIAMANERSPYMRFLIAGDGTERQRFESDVHGCTNVQFLGWRRDIEQVWAAADAALLTSRNEGTPTCLIEAMATGLPFVATDVGGVRDLIVAPVRELPNGQGHEAKNGYLTAGTPEELLRCLECLAGNLQGARKMGATGRTFVLESYSVDRLAEEMSFFYQTLLAQECNTQSKILRRGEQTAGQTGAETEARQLR